MVASTTAEDRASPTERPRYLPCGVNPPVSRLERVWGRLFDHGGDPPK